MIETTHVTLCGFPYRGECALPSWNHYNILLYYRFEAACLAREEGQLVLQIGALLLQTIQYDVYGCSFLLLLLYFCV